jgi:hypothetical protein
MDKEIQMNFQKQALIRAIRKILPEYGTLEIANGNTSERR